LPRLLGVFTSAVAVITKLAALSLALGANDGPLAKALFAGEYFPSLTVGADLGGGINSGFFTKDDLCGFESPSLARVSLKLGNDRFDPAFILTERALMLFDAALQLLKGGEKLRIFSPDGAYIGGGLRFAQRRNVHFPIDGKNAFLHFIGDKRCGIESVSVRESFDASERAFAEG